MKSFAEWTKEQRQKKTESAEKKQSFVEWTLKNKYAPETVVSSANQTGGTKTSAGGGASRLDLSDRPAVYNEVSDKTGTSASAAPAHTSSGYYSRPELWADAERLEGNVDSAALNVKVLERQRNDLYAAWQKSQSDTAASMWQAVQNQYERERAAYAQALDTYNRYVADQQAQYDAWRGTIRTPEQTSAELSAAQLSIDALEKEKTGIITGFSEAHMFDGASISDAEEGQRVAEIDAQLEKLYDKRDLLAEEYDWARYFGYEGLRSAEDFEKLSKADLEAFGDDNKYKIINGGAVLVNGKYIDPEDGTELSWNADTPYGYMTDEEKSLYNYLYAVKGKRHADEYLNDLVYGTDQTEPLAQRLGKDIADSKLYSSKVGKVLYGGVQGFDNWRLGVQQMFSEDALPPSASGYAVQEMKGDLGAVGSVMQDTASAIGNMAPSILASMFTGGVASAAGATAKAAGVAGKIAGGTFMGASVVGNAYGEKVREGYSPDEARVYAALVGASELFLQNLIGGFSKLGGTASIASVAEKLSSIDNAFGRFAAKLGASMLSEGFEEGLQEILEPMFAALVFNEELEPAKAGDVAYSFLLGALSAGMMEGPGIAKGEIVTSMVNKLIKQEQKQAEVSQKADAIEKVERTPPAPELDEYGRYENADGDTVNPDGTVETITGPRLATADEQDRARRMKSAQTETARSGIKVDATDEQIAVAERLSEVLGREIRFFRAAATEAGVRNGKYDPVTGVISVNVESENPVAQIIAHELTHSVENIEENAYGEAVAVGEYGSLLAGILSHMEKAGEDLAALRQRKKELYAANGVQLQGDLDIDTEIVAEYVEKYLLTDEAAITALTRENRTLGQRILSWIDSVLAKMGVESAQERVFLQNARDMYARALKESDQRETDGDESDVDDGIDEEAFAENVREYAPDAQYSITRTAKKQDEIMANLRSIIKNGGTAADLRQYVDTLDAQERAQAKNKPQEAKPRRQSDAAAEIVRAAHDADMSVEEYLRENAELYETENGWNRDARRALEMESGVRGSTRFSISNADDAFRNAEVNDNIMEMIARVKTGDFRDNDKVFLGRVPDEVAERIQKITGIDVQSFKVAIEARQIKHILKYHGENGLTNQSLADDELIARMEYALHNPEDIRYAGKAQGYSYERGGHSRTADTVMYEKHIGDKSYYVVQAVADTKKKTLYIVTAFIGEKGYKEGTLQIANANSPDETSKNAAVEVPDKSISHPNTSVKEKHSISAERALDTDEDIEIDENAEEEADFAEEPGISDEVRDEVSAYVKEAKQQEKIHKRQEQIRKKKEEQEAKRKRLEESAKKYHDPKTSKRALIDNLLSLFNVLPKSRKKLSGMLNEICGRIASSGRVMEEDVRLLMNVLYNSGVVTEHVDSELKNMGSAVEKGFMYVSPGIRGYFGNEWAEFQERAYRAGVHFTTDPEDASMEVWRSELAALFPETYSADAAPKEFLEKVVRQAENGNIKKMQIGEYNKRLAEAGYISEVEVIDNLEREVRFQLRLFAEKAGLETDLRRVQYAANVASAKLEEERESHRKQRNTERDIHLARERELRGKIEETRKEGIEKVQEEKAKNQNRWNKAVLQRRAQLKAQREHNKKMELAKQLQNKYKWVRSHMKEAPPDLKEKLEELIAGMDTYAIMPLSEKKLDEKDKAFNVSWRDLPDYIDWLKEQDPNFIISQEIKRKVDRVRGSKIADMDVDAIGNALQALIGVQTEFYNRRNMLLEERLEDVELTYQKVSEELAAAPDIKGKNPGSLIDHFFNASQLTAVNMIRRMAGWNPESALYKMANLLEEAGYAEHDYKIKAREKIEEFTKKHEDWMRRADGQGKDAIIITEKVPSLVAMRVGAKPEFGKIEEIQMTPLMRVHMALEAKNVENLRHMAGGRRFADMELYSKGERKEAFAAGKTVRLAPQTVTELCSKMSKEERELFDILHEYYNGQAKKEVNRVSMLLYGYEKAVTKEYAPIITDENYTQSDPGVYDLTAEGAGVMKERRYSTNPSKQMSAIEVFDMHVDRTARFVAYAIPIRNWSMLLNWREKENSMKDQLSHKWGEGGKEYLDVVLTELQTGGKSSDKKKSFDAVGKALNKVYSKTITAVFGLNPSVLSKQFGSLAMALPELGFGNVPWNPAKIARINKKLIGKYTSELAWRASGNASAETQLMLENPNKLQRNKAVRIATGEGITLVDQFTASILWPWAENKVRKEHPELEMGTKAEIEAGDSAFYKQVAKEFNHAVSHSQSMGDIMHQSIARRSDNALTRTFTVFKSDASQAYNQIRQYVGEAQYYDRMSKDKNAGDAEKKAYSEKAKTAKKKVGLAVLGIALNNAWSTLMTFLVSVWKNKAKNYRDDEDEWTFESTMEQMAQDFLSGIAGMVIFGEEIAEAIGSTVTGGQWYDIESPGVDVVNEIAQLFTNSATGAVDFFSRAANVIQDGGDFGKFLEQNIGDVIGGIKDTAITVSSYFGIPAGNLEAYLLGAISWISPRIATAYEDMLETPTKQSLAGLKGPALDQRVGDIMKDRDVEITKEGAQMIADLFDAGHKSVVPSEVPSNITVEGETHELTETQKQKYAEVWANAVRNNLQSVLDSKEFKQADLDDKVFMVRKVYQYGAEFAKNALFKDYKLPEWVLAVSKFKTAEMNMAQYLEVQASKDGIYEDVKDEDLRGLEFAKWVVDKGFTDEQIWVIRECFNKGPEVFYNFVDAGVDADRAYRLTKDLIKLEPVAERENVSTLQKSRVVIDALLPADEELAALSKIMLESEYAKVEAGNAHGITPGVYVTFKELLPQYDADGNGSYSQEEVERAIDSIGPRFGIALPSYGSANAMNTNLTNAQRAVLWQLANKSWKPESNPYSEYVGRKVYNDLNN